MSALQLTLSSTTPALHPPFSSIPLLLPAGRDRGEILLAVCMRGALAPLRGVLMIEQQLSPPLSLSSLTLPSRCAGKKARTEEGHALDKVNVFWTPVDSTVARKVNPEPIQLSIGASRSQVRISKAVAEEAGIPPELCKIKGPNKGVFERNLVSMDKDFNILEVQDGSVEGSHWGFGSRNTTDGQFELLKRFSVEKVAAVAMEEEEEEAE